MPNEILGMETPGFVWLCGVVLLYRRFTGVVYRNEKDEGVGNAMFAGLIGAAIWPLVLSVWTIWKIDCRYPNLWRTIFIKQDSRERKQEKLARSRKRTAELEQELGL